MAWYYVSKVTENKETQNDSNKTVSFFYKKARPLLGALIEAKSTKDILGPWFREYIYESYGDMNVRPVECKYGSQVCVKIRNGKRRTHRELLTIVFNKVETISFKNKNGTFVSHPMDAVTMAGKE